MTDTTVFSVSDPRTDVWMGFGGSLLVHLLIVLSFVVLPMLTRKQATPIAFYHVKLVTPEEIGVKPVAVTKPQPARRRSTARRAAPEPLPVMSVKRLRYQGSDSKVSIAKTTGDVVVPTAVTPVPEIEKDLNRLLPQPVQTKPPEPVARQNQARDEQLKALDELTNPAELPTPRVEPAAEPPSREDEGDIGLAQRLYYTEVWNAIRRQWALPALLRSSQLETIIIVTVRRDGRVLHTRIEKRSGNDAFDQLALRAIRKADPLPPFPEIYSPREQEIGVRFRPQE